MVNCQSVRYGTIWPKNHIYQPEEDLLVKQIFSSTGIDVEIVRYEDESQILPDLLSGRLHLASTSGVIRNSETAECMYLPLLYNSIDHFVSMWNCENGDLYLISKREIEASTNARVLSTTIVGARDFVFRGDITVGENRLDGLRVRVDRSPVSKHFFTFLGADPVPLPYFSVKNALEKGDIDGAENAPFNMMRLGWLSSQTQYYESSYRYLTNFELANTNFFESIKKEEQIKIITAFEDLAKAFLKKSKESRKNTLFQIGKHRKCLDYAPLRSSFIDYLCQKTPNLQRVIKNIDKNSGFDLSPVWSLV